jgi:uncharacterized protein
VRVWIDLANSPHVALFEPVVRVLRERGDEVVLTARDHAQTLPLARRLWEDVTVVGGPSPAALTAKGRAIAARASALRRFARSARPDVALSHGSYAQVLAAASCRLPAVTMMDYEAQPANHLSFRLASFVVVPESFPAAALRRCGARAGRVRRYPGFKEELYLAGFSPLASVREALGVGADEVLAVFRPAPEGSLYHRDGNRRFDDVLAAAARDEGVRVLVLARHPEQRRRYGELPGALVPADALDGQTLLAEADLVVGAGGTMNREAALLGTPTYTLFAGRLAAVDRALLDLGAMHDLRNGADPPLVRRAQPYRAPAAERAAAIMATVTGTLAEACA